MTRFAPLLALLTVTAIGCAAPESEVSGAADEIVTGKVAAASEVDGSIVAVTSPNKPSWICSGSVIAPRVVLTAAHCVEGGNSDKAGWRFEVFFGADRNHRKPTDKVIKVRSFHFPQLYRDAVLSSGGSAATDDIDGDIAILILDSPTTATPVEWNRRALSAADVGEAVRFVGYGLDKPKSDPSGRNGVRKMAETKITQVTPGAVAIPQGRDNPCHGDSGGPMLIDRGGVPTILGVGHMMLGESCDAGADYERTDLYVDFIQDLLDANP